MTWARKWTPVVTCVLACGVSASPGQTSRQGEGSPRQTVSTQQAPPDSRLWIEIRNVTMHLDERATIRVRQLRGAVLSTAAGQPAVLDDRESFAIAVSSGTVALTADDLTKLLDDFVFAYKGAPLRDLRAQPENGHISLTAAG